jgi:hypothetical protein
MDDARMPAAMRALLAAIGLQLALDAAAIATAATAPAGGARWSPLELGVLALDAAVAILLARGSELARALVRLFAALGMAFDAWLLAVTIAWAPPGLAGGVAIATAALLLALSAFAFVVLGRADVRAWAFARWLVRKRAEIDAA